MKSHHKVKTIVIILFWSLWIIINLIGVIPQTPININKNLKRNIAILFPNRWPFFTKNPKEDKSCIYILKKEGNQYNVIPNLKNSSISNLYGIKLSQKSYTLEYGVLSKKIDKDLWYKSIDGDHLMKLSMQDSIKTIKMKWTDDLIGFTKGEYVIAQMDPVPYLWRNNVNKFEMPCNFIKLLIQ